MRKQLMVRVAVLAIALALVTTPASAEGRWQKTANQPECEVWNASPAPEESVTWSGLCVNGRAEGAGELVWRYLADGVLAESVYAGSMKGGKTDGQGVFTFATGSRYEGEWRDGDKNGHGIYVWTSGDRYEGAWRDGHKNGQGVYVWASGNRYEGAWRDGKINGFGVKTWASGARYEGEWQDETPHGNGKFVDADGSIFDGIWSFGCFDHSLQKALGKLLQTAGSRRLSNG